MGISAISLYTACVFGNRQSFGAGNENRGCGIVFGSQEHRYGWTSLRTVCQYSWFGTWKKNKEFEVFQKERQRIFLKKQAYGNLKFRLSASAFFFEPLKQSVGKVELWENIVYNYIAKPSKGYF